VPSERYQLLLAYVYARRGDTVKVGSGSDFDHLMALFSVWGTPTDRIAEIRGQVIEGATSGQALLAFLTPDLAKALPTALADPAALTVENLRSLDQLVADVNAQVGAVPFVRLHIALAPALEACRILLAATPSGPVHGMLANTFMVGARIAFETGDDETSLGLYEDALQAAEGAAGWERAAIRTSHALVTLYSSGDATAAQTIADTAVREANSSDSLAVRARAHALQAEMAARAGRDKRAFAALHLAWRDIDADLADDPARGRFSTGHLDGFEGVCDVHLGRGAAAEPHLARSLVSLTHPRQRVQRAIVTADLAQARLQIGAPEATVTLLHDCIDIAAATRARVPALRVAQVRRGLRPWRTESFVADLDEHLHESLLSP
jgi:hypothetical protein